MAGMVGGAGEDEVTPQKKTFGEGLGRCPQKLLQDNLFELLCGAFCGVVL